MNGFRIRLWKRLKNLVNDRTTIIENLRGSYLRLNDQTGGTLGVIRHALTNLSRSRGAEASASLAYYALFSIFPILLVIVSAGSVFLEQELVKAKLLEAVMSFLPISAPTVNDHIDAVLKARGAVTTFAVVSLIWSGSNVFEKIVININRAFQRGKNPGFIQNRLMALVMILALIALFILSLAINTLIGLLPSLQKAQAAGSSLLHSPALTWLSWLLPLLIKFLLFLGLYTWIPRHISTFVKARIIGALVAAVLWELVTRVLTWAVGSGLTNYQLVYGSLGSIIALLFWLYWTGFILFFGAHLTNAIDFHMNSKLAVKPEAEVRK
ncbi:MAG TPA: YihY/virulence factor BrkB family protein [Anaerolineaceae bacterium]|nr:YihY/virulence factor BrkB family protein [Chloroflexota bacterium]HNY83731.1 YihY/virulence factor BrkB family protein [Anaerolineaceae bacterium]